MGRMPRVAMAALLLLLPAVCAAQGVNMGATFHGLEGRVRRVTLTFPDAVVEVRRSQGGDMGGTLRNAAGAVRGRLDLPVGTRRGLCKGWQRRE